ncbi:unnamed protein product [Protopolystoma xenopodis]|uniref:Uncharacterized protein n=1 Tax=Protopolystoma xenopodis TaxID=117903 RepID=A0A3S5CQM5_9PLAT|nr:unnamed protein product [Protopolystoma xenopodis]
MPFLTYGMVYPSSQLPFAPVSQSPLPASYRKPPASTPRRLRSPKFRPSDQPGPWRAIGFPQAANQRPPPGLLVTNNSLSFEAGSGLTTGRSWSSLQADGAASSLSQSTFLCDSNLHFVNLSHRKPTNVYLGVEIAEFREDRH